MAFNTEVPTSYKYVENGIIYEGSLPTSAMSQFDIYTALLAYWESKTPSTWAYLKAYIVANTKVTEESSGIQLDPVKDLNFQQVKILVEKYLTLASEFFTSPQKKDQ